MFPIKASGAAQTIRDFVRTPTNFRIDKTALDTHRRRQTLTEARRLLYGAFRLNAEGGYRMQDTPAQQRLRASIDAARKALGLSRTQTASLMDYAATHQEKLKRLSAYLNGREGNGQVPRHYLRLVCLLKGLLLDRDMYSDAEHLAAAFTAYLATASPFGRDDLMALPSIHSVEYRFRVPRQESELIPFQSFSDHEEDIARAHGGLRGERRHAFYEAWFEERPDVFLILDRIDDDGAWRPIAVSIILPLIEKGRNGFCSGKLLTVNPDNLTSGLTPFIAPPGYTPSCLLFDTLIVRRQFGKNGKPLLARSQKKRARRESVSRWQIGLVYRHCGLLLTSADELEILVEPDFWQIDLECEIRGFRKIRKYQAFSLWSIASSSNQPDVNKFFETFRRNMEQAGQWQMQNTNV